MGVMDSGFDAAHRPGMTALLLGVMGSCAQAPTHMLCRSFERRCSMTSSQTTPCGSGSRIALRLCGTTAVDVGCRHCERSEAIHGTSAMKVDCFAALAMTGLGTATRNQLGPSFPDVQLHIVDAPLGAGPESITTDGGYGFRARCCASPRNDGFGSWHDALPCAGADPYAVSLVLRDSVR